ncbi:MAG TPA: hypothetical protein VJN18_10200 [Polyangiaceae bacterium]|nr:hypothetical protein [Polyangiaceae bacterium]
MTSPGKPTVTPDDPMILLPEGTPKGWRVYSVQPDATDEKMRKAASALLEQGLHNQWWIQGRGVILVDCRADFDGLVVSIIEGAWD